MGNVPFLIDLVKTKSYSSRMIKATTHYAKTHLSRLLKEVQQGETVIILSGQVPVGKLTAVQAADEKRPAIGTRTSRPVRCAEDAFAPLSEEELRAWGLG